MSDTTITLQRKMDTGNELQSVVRTMKALTASSIGQYQNSIHALDDYSQSLHLGLGACLRSNTHNHFLVHRSLAKRNSVATIVVFGSDQGLVGQFNDNVAKLASEKIKTHPGDCRIWAIGERVRACLANLGLSVAVHFPVPNSIKAVTPLVGEILTEYEKHVENGELYLFYNQINVGVLCSPFELKLLPFDETWHNHFTQTPWPTKMRPEMLGENILSALIREYLFISIFRSCAESLAAENTYRLAAMQRADKNIDELMQDLTKKYNHLRQSSIDEELFDVVSGFEALKRGTGQ